MAYNELLKIKITYMDKSTQYLYTTILDTDISKILADKKSGVLPARTTRTLRVDNIFIRAEDMSSVAIEERLLA